MGLIFKRRTTRKKVDKILKRADVEWEFNNINNTYYFRSRNKEKPLTRREKKYLLDYWCGNLTGIYRVVVDEEY